ncbi:MAG TPA: reverse transcriptase/maturase family protein [Candidatus Paceibacterota bacterium]
MFAHSYENIISVENLLAAWKEFVRGKRGKRDVQEFQHSLMANILALHRDLKSGTYRHDPYTAFKISDPKPRDIHKATVRDRLVHHAVHRILYPFFDRTFIADSYSCRQRKGVHRPINRFRSFACGITAKHRECWVLKCDIRKFFASIDQKILIDIVVGYIPDKRIVALITEIVSSFCSCQTHQTMPTGRIGGVRKGLPLGNLTSQLLVNIYMNEFDQFVKHRLKAKFYIRYADDFVILSHDKELLITMYRYIDTFLRERLHLQLHPGKVSIQNYQSGVDFLGWVHFPDHLVLRTSTKRRMQKRTKGSENEYSIISYLGLLSHGNAYTLATPLRGRLRQIEGKR